MTDTIDQAAFQAATAWNAAHKRGTLIQWRRTADADFTNTARTWTDAYLLHGVPTVRTENGDFVPLADARPHPAMEQLAALAAVKVPELYFPSPPCEFCNVDTEHDGDGFVCPQCLASWSSSGVGESRRCVECGDNEADVIGDDKQPRCLPCAAEVLSGEVEATAPYACKRCRVEVTGIGAQHGGSAFDARLCGLCAHVRDRDARVESWIAKGETAGAR